jgi:curved DNA-binding protein
VVIGGGVVVVDPLGTAARMVRQVLFGGGARRDAGPGLVGTLRRFGRRLLGLDARREMPGSPDATMTVRVTRGEAERGARKRVTVTAGGRAEEVLVRIPAGTAAGARLRLRGKGRTAPGGGRGDLYLTVDIVEGW